ncbi:hypothetical protein OKW24_003632 [Peribacillus simplex]|nr:hypothetical protein [Peribacillus simplex]
MFKNHIYSSMNAVKVVIAKLLGQFIEMGLIHMPCYLSQREMTPFRYKVLYSNATSSYTAYFYLNIIIFNPFHRKIFKSDIHFLQFGFVFLDWYRETPKINLIPSQLG